MLNKRHICKLPRYKLKISPRTKHKIYIILFSRFTQTDVNKATCERNISTTDTPPFKASAFYVMQGTSANDAKISYVGCRINWSINV